MENLNILKFFYEFSFFFHESCFLFWTMLFKLITNFLKMGVPKNIWLMEHIFDLFACF